MRLGDSDTLRAVLRGKLVTAWMWVCVAGATAAAQPPGDAERAAEQFHRGEAAYAARDFEGALHEFQRSFDATGSPNALLAMARCQRELGRLVEAVEAYERTIAEAGLRAETDPFYARTQGVAKSELAAIVGKVGRLRLEVHPPEASVVLNGRSWGAGSGPRSQPVVPGVSVVEVRAPGYATARREIVVAAGEQGTARITLAPLAPRSSGGRVAAPGEGEMPGQNGPRTAPRGGSSGSLLAPLGWTALALGAAGVGTFAVLYGMASAQHDELKASCVSEPCSRATYDDLSGTGRTYQSAAYVGLGVGAAALALGGALLLWDAASAPAADVQLSARGALVSWGGSF